MRRVLIMCAVVSLAAVGCSTNESPTIVEPTQAPALTKAPEASGAINEHGTKTFTSQSFSLELELDNFYFEPTHIKSPGDATAKLELHNEGDLLHTFTSDALNVDEELQPGDTKEIEVKIGAESIYEFHCRFHGDQGMRGSFQPH